MLACEVSFAEDVVDAEGSQPGSGSQRGSGTSISGSLMGNSGIRYVIYPLKRAPKILVPH